MDGKIPVNQDPEQAAPGWRLIRGGDSPLGTARLRAVHGDFRVEEVLPFDPSGSGQHLLLVIRQDDWNSSSAARWLSQVFGCRPRDVGYCGQKDRHAVTVQSFSVPTNNAPESVVGLEWPRGLSLVSAHRHHRKLRRGVHRGNRFRIRLRDVDADPEAVQERLADIVLRGFPNRFGVQRFGRDGDNVTRARDALAGQGYRRRDDGGRSVEISSLRSLLFNVVLSGRVADGSWLQPQSGDLMLLDGTRSFFVADLADDTLSARVAALDVHVSGPLWGRGADQLPAALASRERALLDRYAEDCRLLESRGFTMERRALRAPARELAWHWVDQGELELQFLLGRGSYATALLGELFDLYEPMTP